MQHNPYQAGDSYIGYLYQGLFSLVVLFDANDDEDVSIETQDDVVLEGREKVLHQLKHSMGTPPELTIKNDGFWKTIRIWAEGGSFNLRRYVFVTCASIAVDSPLLELTQISGSRNSCLEAMSAEAEQVCLSVDTAKKKGLTPPYKDRYPGCRTFLHLPSKQKRLLVERILVKPDMFKASDIESQVSHRLTNYLSPNIRGRVVNRLLEWWGHRVTKALLGLAPRIISKAELQSFLQAVIADFRETTLPDYYSNQRPGDLNAELGTFMERQISLVDGGQARILRAALARWRARNQRHRWITEDISLAALLDEFDERLVEAWSDRHLPMCEECSSSPEAILRKQGRRILDWSHLDAPREINPIRPEWSPHFLVQGTFQQLADELRIGWHPRYSELLNNNGAD